MTARSTHNTPETAGTTDERYLTVEEAAEIAGKNPETIRRWIRQGRLEARSRGRSYEVSERALTALISGEVDARPPAGGGIFDPRWGPFTRDPFHE